MNSIRKSLSGKCMALLIGIMMSAVVFPVFPAAALTHDSYPWVYEDYEINDIEQRIASQDIQLNDATAKWAEGGVGGTKGSVNVTISQNYGCMRNKINMVKGQEYKLSTWIKLKNMTLTNNTAHFILYFPAESDGTNLYTDIAMYNAGLNADEWVKVETTYTHDGMGQRVGAQRREAVLPEGTVEIRLGNGVAANSTDAGKFDFFMDDFIVEPIVEGPPTEEEPEPEVPDDSSNLIGDGSFDHGFDSSKWILDYKLTVTHQTGGANGTAGCVLLDNEGSAFGALTKVLPCLPVNRAYRISFYAKAKDGVVESDGSVTNTSGKRVRLIVDNHDGLTHSDVTRYNYISFDKKLTTEWQKYETIYYKSVTTYESEKTVQSTIFPRVGTEGIPDEGREKVHYYLDEYKVEELPIPYNGDFSAPLSEGWSAVGATAELSDDIPAGSAAIKSAHINTTADYGCFSQVMPIENGKSYELSFWAKGAALAGGTAPFSVILDRNAGKSFEGEYAFDGPSFETLTQGKDGDLTLTTQWKKYTVPYKADFSSAYDCTPTIYWRVGASGATGKGAEYYLADIVLTEVTEEEPEDPKESFDKPLAKNLEIEGDPIVGEPLRIKYKYEGTNSEGKSLVRILKAVDAQKSGWATVRSGFASKEAYDDYVIDPICLDQPMKVEVFAIDSHGTPGPVSVLEIGVAKAGLIVRPSFPSGWGSGNVVGEVYMESNRPGAEKKSILMIMSLYNENNMMCAQTEKSVELISGDKKEVTLQLPLTGNACKVRLFVWEGTDSLNTSMAAYADAAELQAK